MAEQASTDNVAKKTGNVVKNTDFKSKGDWVNQIITATCCAEGIGRVEEQRDEEGKVTVRGKAGKTVLNVEALKRLANGNSILVRPEPYPNPGMARMNIGNMLRAKARHMRGLWLAPNPSNPDWEWEFYGAPEDFVVHDKADFPGGVVINTLDDFWGGFNTAGAA